jgi:hypothetical protein
MESITGPEGPDLEVLVHCFSWCSCGGETHEADHIKLKTFKRPVKPGQTVAISYGMGDFDRQKHLFGHIDGCESESVILEFGGEWEVEGLMSALVSLSEKHSAVWLDQLSIPQDSDSITLHLQFMPQIYRGFEVVVLLPNAPCYCLKDALDSWTSEGLHADEDGDFNIPRISQKCMNAVPVSSYHFRLWTKQEFQYARTISTHYCGAPGKCLRGTSDQSFEELDTLLQGSGHLSRWALWKYDLCARMTSDQSEHAKRMGYSTFVAAHRDGETHLESEIFAFLTKKYRYMTGHMASDMSRLTTRDLGAQLASFLLGNKLRRDPHEFENMFVSHDLQSEYVASSQKDFALAVLPAAKEYRLPQGYVNMSLPELIENGIEQYQRYDNECFKTMLPRGLFEDGIGSMRPKPSLHLRTEKIRCLNDVYGSLLDDSFPNIAGSKVRWVSLLRLRDANPRISRLALSKTYAEAFGSASTAEVCDFMRKLPWNSISESRVRDYGEWARAIYYGEVPAPVNGWPSSSHEQALLQASMELEKPWGPWSGIDHEKACYSFMCDYVRIHPDVARENGLGVVVKTSDPACIGFVNRVLYDKIRAAEQYQYMRRHGFPAPQRWRRQNGIDSEDWLTISLESRTAKLGRALEVVRVDTRRDFPEHPINDSRSRSRYRTSVPMYVVRDVWYDCPRDDACIGADLAEDEADDYDAILI